jgi:hypothetical protein
MTIVTTHYRPKRTSRKRHAEAEAEDLDIRRRA